MNSLEKWAAAGGEAIEDFPTSETPEKVAYADEASKKFPVHSKAATMSSIIAFYGLSPKDQDPVVESKLSKHARLWNIECDLNKFAASMLEEEVTYALPETEEIPLVDPEKAAACLVANRSRFSMHETKTAAENILGTGYAGSLRDKIRIMACDGTCEPASVKFAAEIRIKQSRTEAEKKALEKISADAESICTDHEQLMKVATILDEIDSIDRSKSCYETTLPAPEVSLFRRPSAVKCAASDEVTLQNGKTVSIDDCCKESTLQILGPDMVEDLSTDGKIDRTKVAITLPTLPMDDADLLCGRL